MSNYYPTSTRPTPLNLAVARVLVTGLLLWKLIWYEWAVLRAWPAPLYDILPVFRQSVLLSRIRWVVLICGVLLLAVMVGYRLRVTTWSAALLLTYLGTVRHAYQLSHTSRILFSGALFLLLFGVFAEEDRLSLDQLRRTRRMSRESLVDHLKDGPDAYPHRALKWALVVTGVFYFHAGISKLVIGGPVAWFRPVNLGRYIAFQVGEGPSWVLGELLLQWPPLLAAAAVMTVVLEVGFLPYILTGRDIRPFLLGLGGMHLAIVFSVGPVFLDQLVILTVFVPWDDIAARLQSSDELVVVFDRQCFFCARSLHPFPYLDATGALTFHDQSTVPESLVYDGVDFEEAMYVFRSGKPIQGYQAFVKLFQQLGILVPVGLAMRLPGVRHVGTRLYRYIAANRSRYFVCSPND